MTLIKILDQTHPEYDGKTLEELWALYAGGSAWRSLVSIWIPKNSEEPRALHQERKKRALYVNLAGPAVDQIAAFLFSEPPQTEDLPDGLDGFPDDVDRAGSPLSRWFRDRFRDALVHQRSYAWANMPARPEDEAAPDNRADEEAMGLLDVFLVAPDPKAVIDWTEDIHGNLASVMIRDVRDERVDVEAARKTIWRWTFIDATLIRRWEWTPPDSKPNAKPKPTDEATELTPIGHNIGRLPVTRLELPEGLHAMGKLRDPAIGHMRQRNDLSWALHKAAHALMVIKSKWGDEDPVLGAGYFLKLGEKDEVAYAEPSGVSYTAQAEDLKAWREDLFRVVQAMAMAADSDATASRLSAASKEKDWTAMEIVLAAYADMTRQFIGETLEVAAAAKGTKGADISVMGLEGWQREDGETFFALAGMATEAKKLSPLFTKAVAKREAERLLGDELNEKDMEAIRKEIDASDPEAMRTMFGPEPPPFQGNKGDPDPEPDPKDPAGAQGGQ